MLHTEIQELWNQTNALVVDLKPQRVQPHLKLYSSVESKFLASLQASLTQAEKLLATTLLYCSQPDLLASCLHNLKHQTHLLQIIIYYCKTNLYRLNKDTPAALNAVKNWVAAAEKNYAYAKEQKIEEVTNIAQSILINAYNHQAKIHRLKAGVDPENLNMEELKLSEASYLQALKIQLSPTVLHSLGFLLADMASQVTDFDECKKILMQAQHYNLAAAEASPNKPDVDHGLAYILYQIENNNLRAGKPINTSNLIKALAALRSVETYQPNARVHYDKGLIYLLLKDEKNALQQFDLGVEKDPNHLLLRFERGNLLIRNGERTRGLIDLKRGFSFCRDYCSMKEKFKIVHQKTLVNEAKPLLSFFQPHTSTSSIQTAFERALNQIAEYAAIQNSFRPKKVFISYAWGMTEHEEWVYNLALILQKAGIFLFYDRFANASELSNFLNNILESDKIIVVGTHNYKFKCAMLAESKEDKEPVVCAEWARIESLLNRNRITRSSVTPILLQGPLEDAFPPALLSLDKIFLDFENNDFFYKQLFILIGHLYDFSFQDKIWCQIKKEFFSTLVNAPQQESKLVSKL